MSDNENKCNHDIKSEETSIRKLDKFRTMVVPDTRYGVCVYCGQKFKFIYNNEGEEEILDDVDVGGNESEAK